jgi:hypothetical protein
VKGCVEVSFTKNREKEDDMARIGRAYLDTNDMFPKMEFQMVSGEKLKLPEGMGQGYSGVLIYRGEW